MSGVAQGRGEGTVEGTVSGHVSPPDARIAASLILVRDHAAEGLQVLMLRRAEREGDLRSGAAVFPGGVVDARDREAHAHTLGPDDATASARLGLAAGGLDYWIAALRETFEEVGLLLAEGAFDLAALEPWRARLNEGRAGVAELCEQAGIRLDARGLFYWSHWLTPPGAPKRFDTRFFIAHAPQGQQARADLGEAVELMWLTPTAALRPDSGLKLLPVTRSTLQELARHADAESAVAAARANTARLPCVMPRRAVTARGPTVVLPGEWPYAEIGRLDPQGRADAFADLLPGRVVRLSERVLRVTAPNPGPMTGPGTNSYLVGGRDAAGDWRWTVIDPGPASEPHLEALIAAAATEGGRIDRILVTHTHRDHSPAAAALAAATGAVVAGRVAEHPMWQDEHFAPGELLHGGERLALASGVTLRVVHTPGHASNHLCYLLEEEKLLFTGDHVMQGSTVVINPPDGDMAVYLASLRQLLEEDLEWFAPGHGFLVAAPHEVLRALIAHRLRREAKVLAALGADPQTLEQLVARVYDDAPAHLHGVAARSLLAHLFKLQAEGAASEAGGLWARA